MGLRHLLCVGITAIALPGAGWAGQITVAVAANFLTSAVDLAQQFEAETEHTVTLVHGSSGKLYAQIRAGAPFDVFLSADALRPADLVSEGLAQTAVTYALGRLALIRTIKAEGHWQDILQGPDRVAIADPDVAPYGIAARDVLMGVRGPDWARQVVFGDSVGQAFAFVVTGNAGTGLVGLAQANDFSGDMQVIEIPAEHHRPIRQDAVVLTATRDVKAATAFLDFLTGDTARAQIRDAGYGVVE